MSPSEPEPCHHYSHKRTPLFGSHPQGPGVVRVFKVGIQPGASFMAPVWGPFSSSLGLALTVLLQCFSQEHSIFFPDIISYWTRLLYECSKRATVDITTSRGPISFCPIAPYPPSSTQPPLLGETVTQAGATIVCVPSCSGDVSRAAHGTIKANSGSGLHQKTETARDKEHLST